MLSMHPLAQASEECNDTFLNLQPADEGAGGQAADTTAPHTATHTQNTHTNTQPQASKECNDALLNLQPSDEGAGGQAVDTAAVLAVISREIRSEQEPTRLEALRWIHFLLVRWVSCVYYCVLESVCLCASQKYAASTSPRGLRRRAKSTSCSCGELRVRYQHKHTTTPLEAFG